MANRTIRTPEKRNAFLAALREHVGNVSKACEAVAIGRMTAYDWRAADVEFAGEWDEVVEASTEALEQEVYRRAHEGVNEPVFYQGEQCGSVRKYSDTLAMFVLKARRPEKYRENIRQEVSGSIEHTHKVVRVPPKVSKDEWPDIPQSKP